MALDMQPPKSKLQELELAKAGEEELADIRHSNALTTDSGKVKEGYFLSLQLIGALASISLSTTASYWGFSPAAAVIANINADIGPSANSSLFAIIWTTASAVSIIVFGRTSDKFGRRWFVIGASCSGFIGGIIAATAQNMNALIGANVLLGLGAGVHTCYGLTIGEVCPNKWKLVGVVICVIPACIPTGFGAYLAIQLTHTANWRWIYYIFLMMMGVAIVLQVLFYRPPSFRQLHGSERTRMQEIKRVDWIGMFLIIAGLVLFLLGVSWGGSPLPWSSPRILGLLISGAILLVVFGLWEAYGGAPNALVPMHFFKDVRGFSMLFIISSVSGTIYIATAIIWPSQVAAIYASSITTWQDKAWASTTVAFGIWGGIILLGPLISIIKHVRIQLIVMMAFSVAFMGALVSCNSGNFNMSAAFSFLACFPAGILEVATGILVQLDSDDADLGVVFSIIFLGRTAVGSIFTAVFVAILTNKVPGELAKYVPSAAEQAGLPESSIKALFTAIAAGTSDALLAVPGMTPEIAAAVGAALANAYAAAYAYVYYAAIAIGIVGLIACICIKDYDPYFTSHIPRQIYKGGRDDAGAVKEDSLKSERFGGDESGYTLGSEEKSGAIHSEAPRM